MVKNLINRTIVNYILVALGSFLVSKGWITFDLWDVVQGAAEDGILIAAGGGGLVAIIVGAARGITESHKDKVVINGQRAELPGAVAGGLTATIAKDILIGRVR